MQALAIDSVDTWLLETADHHRNAALTSFARFVLVAGHTVPGVMVLALVAVGVVIALRLWRPGIAALVAFLVAGSIADLLKQVIDRPRPPASLAIVPAYGFSMPSSVGAVTSAAAVALILAVNWQSRRARTLCMSAAAVTVVVVGFCMVYLGAHWASDVLAGWALGAVVGALVGFVLRDRAKVSLRSVARSA